MRTLMIVAWTVAGTLLLVAGSSPAQAGTPVTAYAPFVAENPGPGSVPITGMWRFHAGDNLSWAQPGYDDSHWELQQGNDTWGNQGHAGYWGWAWYRKEIDIRHAYKGLGVMMPPVDDAYELYWNGKLIGQFWRVPPHAKMPGTAYSAVFALPANESGDARGTLAVRIWKAIIPMNFAETLGGFEGPSWVGNMALLGVQSQRDLLGWERESLLVHLVSAGTLTSALVALMLYLAEGRQVLYLWFAGYLLVTGVRGFDSLAALQTLPLGWYQMFFFATTLGENVFLWLLLLCLFGMWNEKTWRWSARAVIAVDVGATALDAAVNFYWAQAGKGIWWVDGFGDVIESLAPLFAIVIVIVGLRRTRRQALLPLSVVTVLLALFRLVWENELVLVRFTHSDWFDRMLRHLRFHIGPYVVCTPCHQDILLVAVLLVTMAQYALRERRRKAQVELEMKSAAEVQQLLIPEAEQSAPGYEVESLYRPASEVGGDFFQVMAQADGSTLVTLGDVSGKGLKAAMTVSLIVGTLRTLSEFTSSPEAMLRGLNRRLMGRLGGGFATCLVVRLESHGAVTIGNAGHLAPFLGGSEVTLQGTVPLGIVEEPEFEVVQAQLREGETLTLYTDGIVEARNAKGELYGFARAQKLVASGAHPEAIAADACAFGQEDDITVLSISRSVACEPMGETAPVGEPVVA